MAWKLAEEAKNSGPWRQKLRLFSAASTETSSRTLLETFHAKMRALTTSPRMMAVARSWKTVTSVTRSTTRPSLACIMLRRNNPSEPQANVLRATRTIRPTTAATGILETSGPSSAAPMKKPTATVRPDSRPRPPPPTLMSVWPMSAEPPCTPKIPQSMFPRDWAKHSREVEPRVSVMMSTSMSVARLSTRPTMAIRAPATMATFQTWPLP
mmetsp:Transcript_45778/g.146151  ORF Transcript_45778/g.146151 Transcript_45778/m.146151 type:complete len:211 (+) Transcript_45778:273-905(+)